MLKAEKPKIFSIGHHPPRIGSRVKVWFDKKEKTHLMVEDETGHLTWDIYGVPLSDVVFETEKTPRGAVRCVAFGNLIAITHTNEATEARQMIIREAGRSMDFLLEPRQAMAIRRSAPGADLETMGRLPDILRRRSRALMIRKRITPGLSKVPPLVWGPISRCGNTENIAGTKRAQLARAIAR